MQIVFTGSYPITFLVIVRNDSVPHFIDIFCRYIVVCSAGPIITSLLPGVVAYHSPVVAEGLFRSRKIICFERSISLRSKRGPHTSIKDWRPKSEVILR